jgi:Bacteriophage tail sheath protein
MPEYLAPGVYVEEVSFRAKSIEGVATSTTGFAGLTAFGPVQYTDGGRKGPSTTEPRLVTSFVEFERIYGGLDGLQVGPTGGPFDDRLGYLAHAVRAFFMNGGKRLYVARVFAPRGTAAAPDWGVARATLAVDATHNAVWRARWPGSMGNVLVETTPIRTRNIAFRYDASDPVRSAWGTQAKGVRKGAVVEIYPPTPVANIPTTDEAPDPTKLAVVDIDADGKQTFKRNGATITLAADAVVQLVELRVLVHVDAERIDVYDALGLHQDQIRYAGKILQKDDPEDENAVIWLDWAATAAGADAGALLAALTSTGNRLVRLANGHDGDMPSPSGNDSLEGTEADLDHADVKATGLKALAEIDDIAIVALPDAGTYTDLDTAFTATQALIAHAEDMRYRIAVVDPPAQSSLNEVRKFRGKFDSKYAALYYPWIEILDPTQRAAMGAPPPRISLPPSGFVTGIYARSDTERGVFKAPANEIVRGLTKFELNINKGRQEVINPEGINALRFFEGRGNRIWGARTMSSDPEWKYVNVRRLFIFLEHSIDKATQWAVFEPNNQLLWANIRQMVEDFLLVQWRDGALLGSKPDEAYFVRCDRTTMTQNDLDNGRLICLIGVAPTKPAEFVIFRIGQWTADSKLT